MYRKFPVTPRTFLPTAILIWSMMGFSLPSLAASVEETFLSGLQQLQQNNIPQAQVSLARLPSQSPYSKLLAGNIANQQGDIDQTFLLLLPLQSNTQLIRPAAASLHASLGSAYEKQGAYFNALAHLTEYETLLDETAAIERNHSNIWRMLTALSIQNLIALRGESTDSITQGWIDLALASKQQATGTAVKDWADSYADHPAIALANRLTVQTGTTPANPTAETVPILLKDGPIALILPFNESTPSASSEAFKLGLQTALATKSLSNEIKTYSAIGDQESMADLFALARDEGAAYVISLMPPAASSDDAANLPALTLMAAGSAVQPNLLEAGLSLADEAEAIANFAGKNAIQHVSILAGESPLAQQQVAAFTAAWKTRSDQAVNIITLPADTNFRTLLDLKETIAAQPVDMLLLALSAQEAVKVKPYLDISIPTVGFSSLNNLQGEKPVALHAIRFTDIPFLVDADTADYGTYREASALLASNALKRWFALGVDTVAILAANSQDRTAEMLVKGLTGTTVLDATGQIKRQLPLARFTHDSIVLDQ